MKVCPACITAQAAAVRYYRQSDTLHQAAVANIDISLHLLHIDHQQPAALVVGAQASALRDKQHVLRRAVTMRAGAEGEGFRVNNLVAVADAPSDGCRVRAGVRREDEFGCTCEDRRRSERGVSR